MGGGTPLGRGRLTRRATGTDAASAQPLPHRPAAPPPASPLDPIGRPQPSPAGCSITCTDFVTVLGSDGLRRTHRRGCHVLFGTIRRGAERHGAAPAKYSVSASRSAIGGRHAEHLRSLVASPIGRSTASFPLPPFGRIDPARDEQSTTGNADGDASMRGSSPKTLTVEPVTMTARPPSPTSPCASDSRCGRSRRRTPRPAESPCGRSGERDGAERLRDRERARSERPRRRRAPACGPPSIHAGHASSAGARRQRREPTRWRRRRSTAAPPPPRPALPLRRRCCRSRRWRGRGRRPNTTSTNASLADGPPPSSMSFPRPVERVSSA